jgi:hypothetical protein
MKYGPMLKRVAAAAALSATIAPVVLGVGAGTANARSRVCQAAWDSASYASDRYHGSLESGAGDSAFWLQEFRNARAVWKRNNCS